MKNGTWFQTQLTTDWQDEHVYIFQQVCYYSHISIWYHNNSKLSLKPTLKHQDFNNWNVYVFLNAHLVNVDVITISSLQ